MAQRKVASAAGARSAERRQSIVQAAYETIAEMGFEGLRMREIARRAGLDHATLHYYFDGKEALIEGVMDYMVGELSLGRGSASEDHRLTAGERLAAHFNALERQARQQPEMFVVLMEIHARAARDAGIRAVMEKNERGWLRFLTAILREGVEQGQFAAPMGVEAAAEAAMALIRGLHYGAGSARGMDRALRQLRLWLESRR
jgi:AcrR family transcriptional regulator